VKLKLYFFTLLSFLTLDSLWLGIVAPKFYESQFGHIMAKTPNLLAAGFSICYLFLAF